MRSVVALLAATALSSSFAPLALGQTNGNGKALVASNVLKLRADTPRSTAESVSKQFVVPFAGTVRVRWQFKSDGSGSMAYLSIHSEVDSCFASTARSIYQAGMCDLRVMRGGPISVSAYGGPVVSIRNVRIFYDVVDHTGVGITLLD
jgi:hypothetical protein